MLLQLFSYLTKRSSILKRDWNIYEDITDKPIEIIKLLNNLNQNENFKITDKQ